MISNVQIFTWIGIVPATVRNSIIADFLSGGLDGLRDMSSDDIKSTFASYIKRTDAPFPVVLSPLQKQRLRGLVLLVKDIVRANQTVGFNNDFTRESFLEEISDAIKRDELRVQLKKIGESYLDSSFTHKLRGQSQFKKFMEELSSHLSMIVGVRGVSLNYVIREDVQPHFDPLIPYDEAIIQGITMEGPAFKIDARTVHQIILRNVHEDSDAYVYLKPLLRRQDGSLDIRALRDRYQSEASVQATINSAKAVLSSLRYKNERSFSFERFSSKLQKAYDDLEEAGRRVHNGDIVDALWPMIQCNELQTYVASLKVDYQRQSRGYKLILQDIAAEVAVKRQSTDMKGNSTAISVVHTKLGPCPNSGVHKPDGSMYIGNYDDVKWNHETVQPYHQEILQARKKVRNSRNNYQNQLRNQRRKLNKIQVKIKAARTKLDSLASKDNDSQNTNAGDSFGGRSSMSRVSVVKLNTRTIAKNFIIPKRDEFYKGRVEMDSHADTFLAGRNCTVLNFSERICDVMPYSDTYQPIADVPIVQAATGYTAPDGSQYILVFNEAIYMPTMEHSLLNPNQLRHFGVNVEDNPYCGRQMRIEKSDPDHDDDFVAILKSQGTVIYFDTWTPTDADLNELPHIVLTSPREWDPQRVTFPCSSDIEDKLTYDVYNTRVIKSLLVPTRVSNGPLADDQLLAPKTFISNERHSNTSPEDLSETWGISVQQAKMTLDATTQRHGRSAIMPLSRRYRLDRMYEPKRLRCQISADTMDPHCLSIHGYRYCQVFGNKSMFCAAYPIIKKSDCHVALKRFIIDYGAPDSMITDGSREQTSKGSDFSKRLRKSDIRQVITPPYRHNLNPVELVIRELRKRWYRSMFRTNCPRSLWDYGLPHFAKLMQLTASNAANLNGRTPIESITGETPDISQYLDFSWYCWVWFKENAGLSVPKIGRFLGIADSSSNLMSFRILPESGIPVVAGTVQRVTHLEQQTDVVKERMQDYSNKINLKFKEGRLNWQDLMDNDPDFAEEFGRVFDNSDVPEADAVFDPDAYDHLVNAEFTIDSGNGRKFAKVTKRFRDKNGMPIGTANENPLLDTRMYEVQHIDGSKQALAANIIAENIFDSVDGTGRQELQIDTIVGHRKTTEAIPKGEEFVRASNGVNRRIETTKGWEVLIQWNDGSTTWNKLKDVKDSFPVQLAEYAVLNKISDEPAFAWWVSYTLKKKARIISKIKSKFFKTTHKYGIRLPNSVEDAIAIDRMNGNTLWWDALMKEMKNVRPAFEVYEGDVAKLVGYQRVRCHIIWDIKLGENFRRKARLVAGGHTTKPPSSITYSSVVARDSVRIALTIAALNGLDILSCDIQNAYLSAECREKIFTIAGPEFQSEAGKVMIIKMALYGLKSSGAAFRSKLAGVIWELGYRPSKADPDIWLRPGVKPDGTKYYEMILCYVDDIISISMKPWDAIHGIQRTFKLKNDRADVPKMYLGAGISKVKSVSGTECWTLSSEEYIKTAVRNVEEKLAKSNLRLPTKCPTPFVSGYHPADDTSSELNAEGMNYYQELIGVLRWGIELGRVDILLEVSLLSCHLSLPRSGHLNQVYHIFGYLKHSSRRRLFFDPDPPCISRDRFHNFDWVDFYNDAKEDIPIDMPEPRGIAVETHCFVDASHASERLQRRSQTGILIFINKAPIIFYSKRQNSVETSTFGAEFTACRQAVELLKGLRYKLRMFGVPIDGATCIYCDNESVYKNIAFPTSVLKKKMHSISYHFCREAVAAGIVQVAKEDTRTNLADLFTKVMSKPRRDDLIDRFMY